MGRLFVGQTELPQLLVGDAVEMVDMQVLVAFALGMPQHGSFQTFELIERHPADPPAGAQWTACRIDRIRIAEGQIQRGLRFGGNSGG